MDVINFLFCDLCNEWCILKKKRNITKSCHEFWYMTFNSYIQFGQMRLIIKIIDYDNFILASQGPQPLLLESCCYCTCIMYFLLVFVCSTCNCIHPLASFLSLSQYLIQLFLPRIIFALLHFQMILPLLNSPGLSKKYILFAN